MSDNLEKLFKTALEQVAVEPPERVWERVSAHLAMKQRRHRQFIYSSIAAAIILLMGIVPFFQNKTEIDPLYPHGLPIVSNIKQPLESNIKPITSLVVFSKASEFVVNDKAEVSREQTFEPCEIIPYPFENRLRGETQPKAELKNTDLRQNFIPLTSKQAIENYREYLALLTDLSTPEKKSPKKQATLKYSLGGYIAPGYSFGSYHMDNQETRAIQYSEDQMSGIFNLSGGLNFSVKPHPHFSIETGIGYSRMGQKTSHAPVYAPQSYSYLISANAQESFKLENTVFTPLGRVKSKSAVKGYGIRFLVASVNTSDNNGTIEQQFDAIEIPLSLRYYINDNKILFSVLGGLGASFLVRNQTYMRYNGITEKMGKTEGIRNFNLNTHIAIGVEYPLSKAIHIKLEPGFRYYLQSLSKNNDIDFKPYSFTFATGIGITF